MRKLLRLPELRRALGVEDASRRFLLYFVMPLWMGFRTLEQRPEAPVPPTPAARPGG